jgi:cysteine synthase A/ornithine cyclodeaminase
MFEFSVISGQHVKAILAQDPAAWIDVVARAYLAHDAGQTVNPDSYFLRFPAQPRNRIIALPAAIEADFDVAGIKWIASFPANVEQGIPRASAVLVLNDPSTGYPYDLLEGALISAVRTAASAVLGAYWLTGRRRQAGTVGFIGAGVIARHILDMFVADGWQLERIGVHDIDGPSRAAFAAHAHAVASDTPVSEQSLAAALEADIVVLATTVGEPYITAPRRFRPGQVVLNISLRDIGPELILDAQNLFDDVEHCMKANTSPHLAEQLAGHRDFVSGTLAQLMRGTIAIDPARPVVFSPFGMGILDLALGKRIHERALASGQALAIPQFFGETARW